MTNTGALLRALEALFRASTDVLATSLSAMRNEGEYNIQPLSALRSDGSRRQEQQPPKVAAHAGTMTGEHFYLSINIPE